MTGFYLLGCGQPRTELASSTYSSSFEYIERVLQYKDCTHCQKPRLHCQKLSNGNVRPHSAEFFGSECSDDCSAAHIALRFFGVLAQARSAPGAWHTTKPCSYSHIAHTHKLSWSPVGVQRRPSSCGTSFLWYNALPFVASLGGSCSLRGFPWSVLAAIFCVHELVASSLLRGRVQELRFSCWLTKRALKMMVVATHGVHLCMCIARLTVVRFGCSLLRT